MKLGVFDSGIGGEAVAASLKSSFPDADIITVNDHANIPYGDKPADVVISLTDAAIQPLLAAGCDVIILACNTATALAIEFLREKYPEQNFIGLEPMVKPAAELTKNGTVAICATPATLASDRYLQLKNKYSQNIKVLEPDCSRWAYLIEHSQINQSEVENTINTVCSQGADVVVLGCTHYHWIKEIIQQAAEGRAEIIDPSEAIARRIKDLIEYTKTP